MAELPAFPTVTAPVHYWSRLCPDALAVSDGFQSLTYAALAEAVSQRSVRLSHSGSPAITWVPGEGRELDRLLEFCAIVGTGRAAAIGEPDWTGAQLETVQSALRPTAFEGQRPASDRAFYVGFTSGSTGVPKGLIRSHRSWTESFRSALLSLGPGVAERVLAPGRLSHSLFLFAALLGLWTGAGVHLQTRFSPGLCLDLLAAGAAGCIVAVPSQLLLMLESAERRGRLPIGGVLLVLIGGARWPRRETVRLRRLFPNARIIEFYGASETSLIAWTESEPDLPEAVVGRPFSGVDLRIQTPVELGQAGLIFVRSPLLFDGYVTGDDGSLIRDGDWLSIGDMGCFDSSGRLLLHGRRQRMIVIAARNIFPEEIESTLETHPGVSSASVLGVADALRGQSMLAILEPKDATAPSFEALEAHCRALLPSYKVPRAFAICADWPRTAGGKTDHARLAALYGQCQT